MKLKIFLKKLRCNDKHTNTIRIQLKKGEETLADKTENIYLTYVSEKWELHRIIDKIEDLLRRNIGYNDRHTNTIRIQLRKDVETYSVNSEALHLTYGW